jgi:type IV secretory pathway TrbL component
MNRDGAPSNDTLNRVASALGVPVDQAVTRLNAMSAGVQAQLSVLAKARGVNPEQFANWARDNRRGESLHAMQGHVQSRNLLSWDGLINEFKARGQK